MTTLELSKNIRLIRKAKGLTQKDIAERLFINERTYSKFERGEKKSIDFRFLNAIAKVLQTDLSTLIKTEAELEEALGTAPDNNELLSGQLRQNQRSLTEILLHLRELEQKIDRISANTDHLSVRNILPIL